MARILSLMEFGDRRLSRLTTTPTGSQNPRPVPPKNGGTRTGQPLVSLWFVNPKSRRMGAPSLSRLLRQGGDFNFPFSEGTSKLLRTQVYSPADEVSVREVFRPPRKRPRGLKPALVSGRLRGAEAPLFHGAAPTAYYISKCVIREISVTVKLCRSRAFRTKSEPRSKAADRSVRPTRYLISFMASRVP
jgi:hypothetical protein